MIKQIIWDFDGVLIFSDEIREEGFREVLKEYNPVIIEKFLNYHRANGGLSRYVKFRYMFRELMGSEPDEKVVQDLADSFSNIMKSKMVDSSLLNQKALDFIRNNGKHLNHHIASGSDGNELRFLCSALGISDYFISIEGSPTPKKEIVKGILAKFDYKNEDTCLVGDAINDWEAAKESNIRFYGYNNESLKYLADKYIFQFENETFNEQ